MKVNATTDEEWEQWRASRSPAVQEAIKRFPAGWYRITNTGQIAMLISYGEGDDGSCNHSGVFVPPRFSPFPGGHKVLDVCHDKLEKVNDGLATDEDRIALGVFMDEGGVDA